MYKASVVIPVYKAQGTLRRCVESILYGEEKNLEIILVEDCSPDDSWAVCQKLAEEFSNIRCIRNPQNSGVSHTRNRGMAAAQGEYILFVDSDDWVSGAYASRLTATAEAYSQDLVMCGFRFHENVEGYQQTYIWDDSGRDTVIVQQSRFFELASKVLIQSPCNKAFRRSIIEAHDLRFDETQSMGEDFQFVLDYMESASIRQCVVRNEPLYYYIRANHHSLMSNFGLSDSSKRFERFQRLYRLSGNSAESRQLYEENCRNLKNNLIYHIARTPKLSRAEKLEKIEVLLGNGHAARYYRNQQVIAFKEQILQCRQRLSGLPKRVKGKIKRIQNAQNLAQIRSQLHRDRVSILSQNCIGGVFYHDMGLPFQSPTINLFFCAEDFVRFVSNLDHYLPLELQMHWGETYPIGTLDDISVHFMHYASCTEAKAAWERRVQRIDPENLVVLSTDRNGFTREVFEKWKNIPYPKVLFTADPAFAQESGSVFYPHYQADGCVPDLIPAREFYKDGVLISVINHV